MIRDRFDRIDYMNARRNAKPASGGADHTLYVNKAAERERVSGLNTFRRIGEAAWSRLDAIRRQAREDHNRIVSRLAADDLVF